MKNITGAQLRAKKRPMATTLLVNFLMDFEIWFKFTTITSINLCMYLQQYHILIMFICNPTIMRQRCEITMWFNPLNISKSSFIFKIIQS